MLGLALAVLAARPAAAASSCASTLPEALAAHSYEAVVDYRNGNAELRGTLDLQKPDRIHVTEPNFEIIGIGKKTWIRTNDGSWQRFPVATGSMASMDPRLLGKAKGSPRCVDAGIGIWHGQIAHIYRATYTNSHGLLTRTTTYVGMDGFTRHVEFQTATSSGTEDFSKFNAVTVNPP